MKYVSSALAALLLIANTGSAMAANAAVTKDTCIKMANTTEPFILVLSEGDDLRDSIAQCVKDAKLPGAMINGLGQVKEIDLAYFSSDPKAKPVVTHFAGYYELASVTGNVAKNGDRYYTHIHGVLADKAFHGIAGHIDLAKVGMTVEISIVPLKAALERTVDGDTGFGPIITE